MVEAAAWMEYTEVDESFTSRLPTEPHAAFVPNPGQHQGTGPVLGWLRELGLGSSIADVVAREAITVEALARMDHDALRTIGVGRMGDRLTLLGRARDALLTRDSAGGLGGARNPLISRSDRELIEPAHRKKLMQTLSAPQTFKNKWSGLPQMSVALRIAPIHAAGAMSAEDSVLVQAVLKHLREYWGNMAIASAVIISTLLPVLFSNDPAISTRNPEDLIITGDWVLTEEQMAYIHVTFAMLMSTAVCCAVATLASALMLHIQLFVIMVDMSDQVHFLTHTRVDLPHRLLILTLVLMIASMPFGHLLVYGLYPACYLGLLCVVFTGWMYGLTLYFRKRAADVMRHKYQLAAAELGRGSVIYLKEVLTQRLLRRYLRVWQDATRAGEARERSKEATSVRGRSRTPAAKDVISSRVHPAVGPTEEEAPTSRGNEDVEEFLRQECGDLVQGLEIARGQ